MKRILVILILVLGTVAWDKPSTGPQKLALIIAIGDYSPATGWKSISSQNDIKYIKSALMDQGFEAPNIDTITNAAATRVGVIAAIDRLIAKAKPGDIIVFHYSGHGQQLFDDNGDEADGYDEAIVPYDANMRYSPGVYTGQNHIRDDELGAKFKQLKNKIGVNGSLLVLLDACHSGTATRGQEMAITRGADIKCEPANYHPALQAPNKEGVFDDAGLLNNMVVISAASADQLNYETKDAENNGVGSLSYAFSRAISQIKGPVNYKILFEKIKTDIQNWKPFQSPQIEGNTSLAVMGGKTIASPDIIRITRWNADQTIEIPRGTLHGIIKASSFSLYPIDVTDFKNTTPIAKGTILHTALSFSVGSIEGTVPDKSKAYNVVFDSKSFGDMAVSVKLGEDLAQSAEVIRNKLAALPYISLNQSSADIAINTFIDPATQQKQWQVLAVNDSVLWKKDWTAAGLSEIDADAIKEQVKQYARAQYLRSIYTSLDAVFPYVAVDIIPGIIKTVNGVDTLIEQKTIDQQKNPKGDIQFLEANDEQEKNEGFVIRIRNMQDYAIYLSVLDIMPDNAVAVVIPDPNDMNSTADDYKIAAQKTFTTRPIKLYPPYGKDFMKILITRTAMDLSGIQQTRTRGAQPDHFSNSFEQFYNDTFKDEQSVKTRGPKVAPVRVEEIKIVPFTYLIQKRG